MKAVGEGIGSIILLILILLLSGQNRDMIFNDNTNIALNNADSYYEATPLSPEERKKVLTLVMNRMLFIFLYQNNY